MNVSTSVYTLFRYSVILGCLFFLCAPDTSAFQRRSRTGRRGTTAPATAKPASRPPNPPAPAKAPDDSPLLTLTTNEEIEDFVTFMVQYKSQLQKDKFESTAAFFARAKELNKTILYQDVPLNRIACVLGTFYYYDPETKTLRLTSSTGLDILVPGFQVKTSVHLEPETARRVFNLYKVAFVGTYLYDPNNWMYQSRVEMKPDYYWFFLPNESALPRTYVR